MEEKYSKSKVYKLQDDINFYFYIGSTYNVLNKRLYQHKKDSKKFTERKIYKYFNSIGWENVKIILIQEFNLQNKQQLLREEDKMIQLHLNNENCLNVIRPFYGLTRSDQKKLYKEEHKEHLSEKNKEYYIRTHQERLEYHKKYRENNKEKIKNMKKEYYQNNKEKVIEKTNQYRNENLEKCKTRRKELYEINKEKVICICGSQFNKDSVIKHEKTKKHLLFVENNSLN